MPNGDNTASFASCNNSSTTVGASSTKTINYKKMFQNLIITVNFVVENVIHISKLRQ